MHLRTDAVMALVYAEAYLKLPVVVGDSNVPLSMMEGFDLSTLSILSRCLQPRTSMIGALR